MPTTHRRLAALATSALLAACGPAGEAPPSEPAPAGGGTVFEGVLAGGRAVDSGRLRFAVADDVEADPAADARASGTLATAAGRVVLSGTWSDGQVTLEGGGFALAGALVPEGLAGTYDGPNGAGTFVAHADASGLLPMCGTYEGADTGVWNPLVFPGAPPLGVFASQAGRNGVITGTLTGSRLVVASGAKLTGEGELAGGDATGTWRFESSTGTWRGRADACPSP